MLEIKILWTGGYDSSFRVAQLSTVECVVQPYYLKDNRKSEALELNAIATITDMLHNRPATRALIKPPFIMHSSEVRKEPGITEIYQHFHKKHNLGSQYDWLARFALDHPGLELGLHGGVGQGLKTIRKYARLEKVVEGDIQYYILDKANATEEIYALFGNYHLPLVELTKLDMRRLYQQWGMDDIAKRTWFCHTPIDGAPCGKCDPCQQRIAAGFAKDFSSQALLRYRELKRENQKKQVKAKLRPMAHFAKRLLRIPKKLLSFFR